MSTLPWDSDRELDGARVSELLAARFPELAFSDVRYLAEGWDSQVFEVAGTWVFRFPKRAVVEADFIVETALLPALRQHLARHEAGVQVPAFEYLGEASALFPYRYVGYRKLLGDQISRVPSAQVPQEVLGRQLGRALTALHAFPAEQARELGVPESMPSRHISAMAERALVTLDKVQAALEPELVARVRAGLSGTRPAEYAGPPALVHNDLLDDHILLDCRTRELCGIIDWSDTSLGDPAVDLVGIEAWGGRALTELVVASYGGALDAGAMERVRFRTLAVGVFCAYYAVARGATGELERSIRAMRGALEA